MERIPEIRTVGDAPEEMKEQVKDEIAKKFQEQRASLSSKELAIFKHNEYEKTPEHLALIQFANEETNRIMQEVGVEPYNVPADNLYILKPKLYKKIAGEDGTATTFFQHQGVVFEGTPEMRKNYIFFGSTTLHEMLHLKGHLTMEVSEQEDKANATPYRMGISIRALQALPFHEHFLGLHEAVVALQEKKSFPRMLELSILSEERQRLESSEALVLRKTIAEKKEISEDEIIWVGKNEEEYEAITYRGEREVLEYVMSEIQKEMPEEFGSKDDVFKEFLKAHFTGKLLTVGRLVEQVFGEGSFRILSNMQTNKGDAILCLETLRKARTRTKKI